MEREKWRQRLPSNKKEHARAQIRVGNLETVTVDEVLKIHEVLVADFAKTGDPIGQMGVRNRALLDSAVARQFVGNGSVLKYPDPLVSAATLTYGICCNHPFINGNKRTALVAMLVHLDKNRFCLHGANQGDLFNLMLAVAGHTLPTRRSSRRTAGGGVEPDEEVAAIAAWLKIRTQRIRRGERTITYRQLRQILGRFSISLENPVSNTIEVIRSETQPPTLFRPRARIVTRRLGRIGYHNDGTEVSVRDLKDLRRIANLTEADGVDSDAFYGDAAVVDVFVNRYRTLLRRLAKT